MARLRKWVVHPFLLAAYAALAFFAHNLGQLEPKDIVRPLVASLALSLLLLVLMRLILRDWGRGALAASFVTLLVLSYGHAYDGLKVFGVSGATVVRHRYLLPATLLVAVVGVAAVSRIRSTQVWTPTLTAIGIFALVGPLALIAEFYVPMALWSLGEGAGTRGCRLQPGPVRPDVYLIVLDAYERDDVLQEVRGYDNSWFLGQLEEMGFYIARGSLSNYAFTRFSIPSVLNSAYVEEFPERFGPAPSRVQQLIDKISDNSLRHELECIGYSTVAFETGVHWTEWRDADYYLQRGQGDGDGYNPLGELSRPEFSFLNTTLARAVLDAWHQVDQAGGISAPDPRDDHRERILFVLDQLKQVASLPSPKLVFAHIVSPHPPYVFGSTGEDVRQGQFETESDNRNSDAYTRQIDYLNKEIVEVLGYVLQHSDTPPVIVVMGDHGWTYASDEARLSILNVYYLPEGTDGLYPTMTPVNTFRLVMDRYFGGDFGLLPDKSYYSTHEDDFNLRLVPNTWPRNGDTSRP